MDKLKQWIALTALGSLAILAAGWFLLVSPKHGEASDLKAQAATQFTANTSLSGQIAMLKAQAKDLPKQQARLAAVAAKIPDNPNLPALVRSLTQAADETGVVLVSLSPSTPAAVTPAAPALPVSAADARGGATPGATGAKAVGASSGGAGTLMAINVNANVVGSYFQVEQFLDRVESLNRAMKVTGLTVAPGVSPLSPQVAVGAPSLDTGKSLSATITGVVYMASGRSVAATTVAGK
jgi:Tfp pilus assembly protein PilO